MLLHLAQKYTTLKSGGGAKQHSTRMKRKTMEPFPSSVFSPSQASQTLYNTTLRCVSFKDLWKCNSLQSFQCREIEAIIYKKGFCRKRIIG